MHKNLPAAPPRMPPKAPLSASAGEAAGSGGLRLAALLHPPLPPRAAPLCLAPRGLRLQPRCSALLCSACTPLRATLPAPERACAAPPYTLRRLAPCTRLGLEPNRWDPHRLHAAWKERGREGTTGWRRREERDAGVGEDDARWVRRRCRCWGRSHRVGEEDSGMSEGAGGARNEGGERRAR
jgi:hypothetical protein